MAATFDSTSNAGALNANSASWAHTLGGGSNLVLVVLIAGAAGTPSTVTSGTYGGQSLTQLASARQVNGFVWSDIWYLVAPSGNQTITVNLSGTDELYAGAIVAKDAAQTSSFGTVATNTGSASPSTNTVTSATDEIAVATVVGARFGNSSLFTPTVGVERWNLNNGFDTSTASGVSIVGSASAAFGWTHAPNAMPWASSGISVKPFLGGGTWKTTLDLPVGSISTRLGLARSSIKTMLGLTP